MPMQCVQIPGEAEEAIMRLRRKLESPGFDGRTVSRAAMVAIDSLELIVEYLQQWDLKPHQVLSCC